MIKNTRLEILSDKVRMGEPISIFEALEVVEYQEQLEEERDRKNPWKQFIKWFENVKRKINNSK